MCQTNVVLEKEGQQEPIMEGVAKLEVLDNGIRISNVFDPPKDMTDVKLKEINFTDGVVTLIAA